MRVLVAGLLRHDSGKTSFTLELISSLQSIGLKPYPYKPIGGHNSWYQYHTLVNSIRLGKLVGEDAYKLAEATGYLDEVEIISPLDFLLAPLDIRHYIDRVRLYLDYLADTDRQIVLFRHTLLAGDTWYSTHYVVEDNLSHTIDSMRESIIEFIEKTGDCIRVSRRQLMSFLYSDELYRGLDNILEYHCSRHQLVIIESFNNAATPIPSALNSIYVVVVAPGRVLVYNGEDYARAVEIAGSIRCFLETVDTASVITLLRKPIASLEWRPRLKSVEGLSSPASEKVASIIAGKR